MENFRPQHPPCMYTSSVSGADPVFSQSSLMTYMFTLPGPKCPFMEICAHVPKTVTLNSGEYRWIAHLWETLSSQRPETPNI